MGTHQGRCPAPLPRCLPYQVGDESHVGSQQQAQGNEVLQAVQRWQKVHHEVNVDGADQPRDEGHHHLPWAVGRAVGISARAGPPPRVSLGTEGWGN